MGSGVVSGLLYSQIGYDLFDTKRALIRSNYLDVIDDGSEFRVLSVNDSGKTSLNDLDEVALIGKVSFYGEKWGLFWWVLDFSELDEEGIFKISVRNNDGIEFECQPFEIGKNLLMNKTIRPVALEQFKERAEKARNQKGWKDCGSTMREAYTQALAIIGLTDFVMDGYENLSAEENVQLREQIMHGLEYMGICQDKATECGFADGAVVHEMSGGFSDTTMDALLCSLAWIKSANVLADVYPEKCSEYVTRAKRAFSFVQKHGPVAGADGFLPIVNGAPDDFKTPAEWATKDLCLLAWAALELSKIDPTFFDVAIGYADEIVERQVDETHAEGGLYGHFYTFNPSTLDEVYGVRFTEKANTHCGYGHDMGAVFPHYILPLIILSRHGKVEADKALKYKDAVLNFAYNYFVPACTDNPFGIIPQGYFGGEGLLVFSGPWHGTNVTYAYAAALAMELAVYTEDLVFKKIAVNNLQWIAGVNAGITNESFVGRTFWRPEMKDGQVVPVSMIEGVGTFAAKGWSNIRGSIVNGFSTNQQFRYNVVPAKETDGPFSFTDEDWIPPAGAWASALSGLYTFNRYYDEKGCKV